MIGYRKFFLTLIALIGYVFILVYSKNPMDPLALGLGLGMLLFPTSAANALEHYSKIKKIADVE